MLLPDDDSCKQLARCPVFLPGTTRWVTRSTLGWVVVTRSTLRWVVEFSGMVLSSILVSPKPSFNNFSI